MHRYILALAWINSIYTAPLTISQLYTILIGDEFFNCHCQGSSLAVAELPCSLDTLDPLCHQFQSSCSCASAPMLFKRAGTEDGCITTEFAAFDPETQGVWEEPPAPVINVKPKKAGTDISSVLPGGDEHRFQISKVLKVPIDEADDFNVYRVTDQDGQQFILREAADGSRDLSNEINVLKKVDQYVAHNPAPNANVVVKIQPGVEMAKLIEEHVHDDDKLNQMLNGGFKALEKLHEENIFHGDPHTGNIMVTEDLETFNFIDFGRSNIAADSDMYFVKLLDDREYFERFEEWLYHRGRKATAKNKDDGSFELIFE